MRNSIRILSVLVLLGLAAPVFAGETGSVSGKVTDASGGTLPGVVVKIAGPQLPAGRTTSTSASGTYNFQRLLPGKYTVEAELQGIGRSIRAVDVQVDNDYQIDLGLRGGTESSVDVVAASVDTRSAEVNVNHSAEEIKNLPLPRTYSGLLQLIPGAASPDGVGVSVSGGTRQDNKYLVDGVDITNPGYGILVVETNELDIADFNVKKGGISAEFGRTSGVIVNAVTRSGTNDLHGGLRFEALPNAFIANSSNSVLTSKTDRYTGAGNLGFPILRDTIFGYASARYFSSTTSERTNPYNALPDGKTRNQDYFAKLTGNLGQKLLVNASFRALPNKSENIYGAFDALSAGYDADTTNYVSNVSASYFLSNNSFIEAKYIHLTESDTQQAQTVLTDQPRTLDPLNLGKYGAFYDPARSGGNSGVAEFADLGDSYKRDDVKFTASQFLDLGPTQHQIKVGGGYENDTYELVRSTNGWGVLRYQNATEIRARYYTRQPVQTGKARTYSAFLQDTITWGRLSANLGILFNKDDFAQIALDGTRYNFMSFGWGDEVQPRIGIVYNTELLKGDKVYFNFGRYYGLDQKSTSRSFAPFRIRQDQAFFSRTTGAYLREQIRGSSTGKIIPSDLKSPYSDEFLIGYAAPLTKTVSVEAYYQYRSTSDIFEDVPIDPDNYNGFFKAANLPDARRRYKGFTVEVNKRFSDRWAADVSYTYSRLTGNFDLDYADNQAVFNTSSIIEDAPGINSSELNRNGNLSQDRPHIFKAFASYELPFGVTLGGYLRYQSGAAWEARGQDGNGSFYRYLEPAGSRRLPGWTNFDFLAGYTFHLCPTMGLRLEARVLNLFNTETALTVDKVQYLDDYVDGNPPRTLGPQGTSNPNPNFGRYTSFSPARRLVLTAILDF